MIVLEKAQKCVINWHLHDDIKDSYKPIGFINYKIYFCSLYKEQNTLHHENVIEAHWIKTLKLKLILLITKSF